MKFTRTLVALAIISVAGISCKKEVTPTSFGNSNHIQTTPKQVVLNETGTTIQATDQIIIFPTIAAYDGFFESLTMNEEGTLNEINSIFSNSSLNKGNICFDDEVLSSILNINRQVQIQDWVFQYDFENETIYSVPVNLFQNQANLNQIEGYKTFSFEEDPLEFLENGTDTRGLFCKETNRSNSGLDQRTATGQWFSKAYIESLQSSGPPLPPFLAYNTVRVVSEARYVKAGFYNTLRIKYYLQYYDKGQQTYAPTYNEYPKAKIKMDHVWAGWKPRCRDKGQKFFKDKVINAADLSRSEGAYQQNFYVRPRGLSQYKIVSNISYKVGDQYPWTAPSELQNHELISWGWKD